MYRIGIDIGSTTAKIVAADKDEKVVYSDYIRHNADITGSLVCLLRNCQSIVGDEKIEATITGSAGLGVSERIGLPFVQEVIAVSDFVKHSKLNINTLIDIGGEDAKIIFFNQGQLPLMRMNGNCAGGTGAFIDQMAVILGVKVEELDALAKGAKHIYPIASRCGVFSKTDVQNLVAKAVSKEDIAASVFNAIALQVISSLSKGIVIKPKLLFCGGPLTYIPSLREAFKRRLNLSDQDTVQLEHSHLIPALGCTYSKVQHLQNLTINSLIEKIEQSLSQLQTDTTNRLERIFESEEELDSWRKAKNNSDRIKELDNFSGEAFLGVDSGSTTTKVVLTDRQHNILFSNYSKNNGNPLKAVQDALDRLQKECKEKNASPNIISACSTGYGEELIKAAFGLDCSVVETIAHYKAAKMLCPEVEFILDIGGQDMKAMYIENGVLNKIELNEACSSGCGSFIETFATSLGYSVSDFAQIATLAQAPCNLGTRCTVFMNSKVKQSLREGASVADISAGLSYSVVKNCLYKVLKIGSAKIGKNVVVQGGTMRNDAIVKAFENLTGTSVFRSAVPELMGAYGCAITACENAVNETAFEKNKTAFQENKTGFQFTETAIGFPQLQTCQTKELYCHGCENKCLVTKYTFANSKVYHSGNKCEKIFTSKEKSEQGDNIYTYKLERVFRNPAPEKPYFRLGVPRVLNLFEDFPFWQAFFSSLNVELVLSDLSTYSDYEKQLFQVLSENICFPAKLVHSHIRNLADKDLDTVFFPYVVYERKDDPTAANTYNCPIVSSYNTIIKQQKDLFAKENLTIDNPAFTFKDTKLLLRNLSDYVATLSSRYPDFHPSKSQIREAMRKALASQSQYEEDIRTKAEEYLAKAEAEGRSVILLAARPYHSDSLIQHKLSDVISSLGATVISDDIVRGRDDLQMSDTYMLSQWAYMNRIVKAAKWTAEQSERVNYIQITSFGCGPDAFLLDEVENIFFRYGKVCTVIKVDDINNVGSMRLRVRSLLESLALKRHEKQIPKAFVNTKTFEQEDRRRTILAPFFTDYASPLLPQIFELSGYKLEVLPKSDESSAEMGLKYSNNEVCYPATLIVGDFIKALQSGKYDLSRTAVGITQTGGQCRASSYYAVIRKALVDAGFEHVPVISVAMGGNMKNNQPGFHLDLVKIFPIAIAAVLFGDCLSQLYHSTVVRCEDKSQAKRLQEDYLETAKPLVLQRDRKGLLQLLASAVRDFNSLMPSEYLERKKVGIVGEIFLKFHSFANKNVIQWLINQDIEVLPPTLLPLFTHGFVNRDTNLKNNLSTSSIPNIAMKAFYGLIRREVKRFNEIMSHFRYFRPQEDIFELAEGVKKTIPLYAQFGEGWLLPAEIIAYAHNKADAVISLQPFGCIANHIISRGTENRIKEQFGDLNLLALDFDSSISEVNVANRLMLLRDSIM